MAKPRKRHVQQSIVFLDRNGQRRGVGPRKVTNRLGRPPNGERAGEKHTRREVFRLGTPVHVILRIAPAIGRLRKPKTYTALREALLVAARRDNFRVVHISIQARHVHLLVEATDRVALGRGMQSFQISAAKRLNAAVTPAGEKRRKGCVFTDRYHAQLIESPRQARHALAYVLNNWRHHLEDREGLAMDWKIDRYSSAISFDGWREPWAAPTRWKIPDDYLPLVVWPPRSWLLREGWKRHGLIGTTEVPGPKAMPDFAEW
jgi:REP element-mobilizing transposase RayT